MRDTTQNLAMDTISSATKDGAVVRSWDFVDDFLIHGPTYGKTSQALLKFLDLAVDCGMLCHPTKLTPPQQVVKYCGFLLDSVKIPCLRVPVSKRERALAPWITFWNLRPPESFPG